MTRTLSLIAASAPLAAGCIIYEDRHRDDPCEEGVDCTVNSPAPPDDLDPDPEPEPEPDPEEPKVTENLTLTVNEGAPGETLLTTLIPVSQEIDLSAVVSVAFERDVEILDTIARPFEIVMVLAVDAGAELGDVEVLVETPQGPGFVLAEPFHIVAGDGSAPSCTPGGTTTDTGCP